MSRKLVGTALIITILSIAAKLSGFLRESIMTRQFGATAETDGYLLSFTFVTLVIAMITNGFNNAFLPLYIKDSKKGGASDRNASSVINWLFLAFLFFSILCFVFAPSIVTFIFSATDADTAAVAIQSTRVFALFLSAVALNGMFESFLQAKRIFVPPNISRLSQTLTSAVFALFFAEKLGILSLAYGFVVGTILGMLLQGIVLWRSDFKWSPSLKIETLYRKEFLALLFPALLNSIVGQVNLFVNKIFASGTTEGAVTYLNSSSLIINIPGQIFATTLAVIIFTLLSEQTNNLDKFKRTVYSGLELSLILLVPISFGLIVAGEPLISLIYEGGAFTSEDTHNTFIAMLLYLPLIITQGMQFIVAKAMYSLGKTATIFKISATTIVLNIILNAVLVKPFGYPGLALSSSLVSLYYFSMCTFSLYRNFEKGEFKKVFYLIIRVFVAALVMLIPLFMLNSITKIDVYSPVIQLLIIVPLGVVFYVVATYFLNRSSFTNITKLVRK
ncbi:murein biosynthesis integral membrane protein MurJ [Aquibacillus rhizosphaerae]|uniref:Lipid II flippase n=1 Tax=Aquibacillus rhizosphaerae TaxID=3051431 RepID=A0ABT7KZD9_9BACI|nr:oligosaccharide flippase family protein [Aquibacillus sp. LR5S19]MDL4838884.1 oligosaccharide flippase family protein [Aquibacillus sp. LR5S19]